MRHVVQDITKTNNVRESKPHTIRQDKTKQQLTDCSTTIGTYDTARLAFALTQWKQVVDTAFLEENIICQ